MMLSTSELVDKKAECLGNLNNIDIGQCDKFSSQTSASKIPTNTS
ncbi:hypothetical protein PF002_g5186 [Phytophthora fragariae]|uniref:Uncharacterized protein n=1 Tax=Phytophthora fragariae TaxID=53985 RepID=A0A6A4A7L0_9STRA|nr:hypothetical protein PF002_g5186 [Phytophthora fragariae]KAE9356457.1 hypothetical protein PF008_g3607 [Phytophthora fragariae]